MFPAPGLRHALVHSDLQVHLPTSALGIGTVLPVGHGTLFFLFLLLRLHNRKAVLHTQLVGCLSQFHKTFLIAVVLETGFEAYRVDHKMRVQMLTVRMGGNDDLIAGDLLRQFQSDLMCHLRGDGIIGTEGLYHVIVHPSVLLYCRLVFINSSRAA